MSMYFISPEQQAALDRRRMEADAGMHTMTDLIFSDLTVDQLNALVLLLEGIQYAPTPAAEAARWYGIISAALHTRFAKCIGCGRDHDQEMLDAINQLQDPTPAQGPVTDEDSNIIGFRLPDGVIDNGGIWHPSKGQHPDDDETDRPAGA